MPILEKRKKLVLILCGFHIMLLNRTHLLAPPLQPPPQKRKHLQTSIFIKLLGKYYASVFQKDTATCQQITKVLKLAGYNDFADMLPTV